MKRLMHLTAITMVLAITVGDVVAEDEKAPQKTDDAEKASEAADASSEEMKLEGGEEGTIFKSLRIEGEDRVRIEFDRPALDLRLDPTEAPGLEWEGIRTVIGRNALDLFAPYIHLSAQERPPIYARPWLDHFSDGNVAVFRPRVDDVDKWRLVVANSHGETVATFAGDGKPPKEITWDGRTTDGTQAPPGLTYSYVLEAYDKAGNKRNFVGDGFELPPYRSQTESEFVMLFDGNAMVEKRPEAAGVTTEPAPGILLEAASWINQRSAEEPIQIRVTARSFDQAKRISDDIVAHLSPVVFGDSARLQLLTDVQPDAPESGTVAIRLSAIH